MSSTATCFKKIIHIIHLLIALFKEHNIEFFDLCKEHKGCRFINIFATVSRGKFSGAAECEERIEGVLQIAGLLIGRGAEQTVVLPAHLNQGAVSAVALPALFDQG